MTKTQVDPATLSGYEQLMAIGEGLLPPAPIAETLGMVNFGGEIGAISVELDPEVRHYNPLGVVHGGSDLDPARHRGRMLGALDAAAGRGLHLARPDREVPPPGHHGVRAAAGRR